MNVIAYLLLAQPAGGERDVPVLDERDGVTTALRFADGRIDAEFGMESADDQVLDSEVVQDRGECRLAKSVAETLVDDRLAGSWRDLACNMHVA